MSLFSRDRLDDYAEEYFDDDEIADDHSAYDLMAPPAAAVPCPPPAFLGCAAADFLGPSGGSGATPTAAQVFFGHSAAELPPGPRSTMRAL